MAPSALRSGRLRLLVATVATLAVAVPIAWMWENSLVPDTYDMATMGYHDYGGGPHGHRHDHQHDHAGTAVADLVEESGRPADVSVTLTVRRQDGRYTVNGTSPGPTIRATVGDLVQVRLVNENIGDGTTLHWHGVDVPNAMDGVAGVTQDAVMPGDDFVYRFVVDRIGTYWYHSHQVSHEQVRNGLFGALVVDPEDPDPAVLDRTVLLHEYGTRATLDGRPGTTAVDALPGRPVRLRVVNTDNVAQTVWVTGAAYEVRAVDGTDLNGPEPVTGKGIEVTAGGRVDLGFVVPPGGARVDFGGTTALTLGGDPSGGREAEPPGELIDLLDYGEPTGTGLDAGHPDREFDYRIGRRLGFLDGRPGRWWTINGHIFPNVPMYMVGEGDVVVFHIDNGSGEPHPMHLHGHHVLVLSRNGEPATGSPWWVDSLDVATGDSYDIAFVADNPGLWMDHCHNLPHAAEGLVTHLMYTDVTSSFSIGGRTDNHPE
ncbi:multicopper oxidase family protein [Nocardioides sp. Soil796]|uniref:multicopper oxidase family protein n=1 Tax=Nocardioides sp. Soil796 TaxID=1736412 RepID=UPI000A9B7FD0|nr:multicopper oxidase family protein [Nocardioides sp. Soil796]